MSALEIGFIAIVFVVMLACAVFVTRVRNRAYDEYQFRRTTKTEIQQMTPEQQVEFIKKLDAQLASADRANKILNERK